jgi:hypothetical protein
MSGERALEALKIFVMALLCVSFLALLVKTFNSVGV